jgi:hypothetical protein
MNSVICARAPISGRQLAPRASAFAGVIADTRVAAARADGARIVTMPHRHRSLSEGSDQPMSPAHQHMAKSWLNRMEGNFAPVTPWFD